MEELAQVYGIDVPRNKCDVCGFWFTTAGEETVCSDCRESEEPRNSFDAFLSRCVSDCVNGRR